MNKKAVKRYDVNKEIEKCGINRELSFSKAGKNYKYKFYRETYCELLKKIDKNILSAENRSEFLASYIQELFGLLDDDSYYEKDENRERERLRKDVDRIHNRILVGKEPNKNSVASDKKCVEFLEKVQKITGLTLLEFIDDENRFYYENTYIYSLVVQLVEIMYSSENYNCVPNSHNYQFKCFQNHLKMIYNNINEIFANESEIKSKWEEILCPIHEMIYNANYPGIKKGDIWQTQCEELKFFDCTYEIAKSYDMYCALKNRLAFDLGDTQEEVQCEMRKYHKFFFNKEDEKILFCNMMLSTLKKIVNNEFNLKVK